MKYDFMLNFQKNKYNFKKSTIMKKKLVIFVSLLFILFFYGCQEDMVDPVLPVTPNLTPKITVEIAYSGFGGKVVTPAISSVQVAKGENLSISIDKEIGIIVRLP